MSVVLWLLIIGFGWQGVYASPLTVQAVVENALANHPDVESQESLIRTYQSELMVKRGKWDMYLESRANVAAHSTYSGDYIDTKLVQPLPFGQMKAYGGYRISGGKFPGYEGGLETLNGGEVYGGVQWSVLESFAIDPDRLALFKADVKIAQQQAKAQTTSLKIQAMAIKAYYEWLAAEAARRIYSRQLGLTQERAQMLDRQIARGNYAKIYAVENEQYLLQRRNDLALASLDVTTSANGLGLFLTQSGARVQPVAVSAPVALLEETVDTATLPHPDAAVAVPPIIQAATLERDFLQEQLKFQRVQRLPKLVVDAKVKRDFGNGAPELDGTDFDLSALLRYPLQNRQGRGEADAAKWRLQALDRQILGQMNQWQVSLSNLEQQIAMYAVIAANTAREAQLALRLEVAERKRWQQGDSELLSVNIREQNTAKAEIRHVKALLDQHKLWAEYLLQAGQLLASDSVATP